MLVRMNIGQYAGKIKDIEVAAARAMVKDGRASTIDYSASSEGAEPEGVAKLCSISDKPKPEGKGKKRS